MKKSNKQVYFGDFSSFEDMCQQMEIDVSVLANAYVLYAVYNHQDYDGDAHIIFIKNGKLYEVNASHCSCDGLAGNWLPEETLLNALLSRPNVDNQAKFNLKEFFRDILIFT